jgi:hypothetical protein
MKNKNKSIGLLSVLENALNPGLVLDDKMVDGMLAILKQVKAEIEEATQPER